MEYSTIMESTTVMFYSHSNLFHNNSGLSGLTDSKKTRKSLQQGIFVRNSHFEVLKFRKTGNFEKLSWNSEILSWTNQNDPYFDPLN